jgi:hypothetical protein
MRELHIVRGLEYEVFRALQAIEVLCSELVFLT